MKSAHLRASKAPHAAESERKPSFCPHSHVCHESFSCPAPLRRESALVIDLAPLLCQCATTRPALFLAAIFCDIAVWEFAGQETRRRINKFACSFATRDTARPASRFHAGDLLVFLGKVWRAHIGVIQLSLSWLAHIQKRRLAKSAASR